MTGIYIYSGIDDPFRGSAPFCPLRRPCFFSNDARAVIFSWDATAHRSDKKNDLDYERLCFIMNCLKLGDGKCNTKNIQNSNLELRTPQSPPLFFYKCAMVKLVGLD